MWRCPLHYWCAYIGTLACIQAESYMMIGLKDTFLERNVRTKQEAVFAGHCKRQGRHPQPNIWEAAQAGDAKSQCRYSVDQSSKIPCQESEHPVRVGGWEDTECQGTWPSMTVKLLVNRELSFRRLVIGLANSQLYKVQTGFNFSSS